MSDEKPPFYIYVGPGQGRGEAHVIVFNTPDEVVTVSKGHAWLGSRELFRQQFRLHSPLK